MERMYEELLKSDLKKLDPEVDSETWEVITHLYRKARRRKFVQWLTGSALTLTAAVVVGIAIYHALHDQPSASSNA